MRPLFSHCGVCTHSPPHASPLLSLTDGMCTVCAWFTPCVHSCLTDGVCTACMCVVQARRTRRSARRCSSRPSIVRRHGSHSRTRHAMRALFSLPTATAHTPCLHSPHQRRTLLTANPDGGHTVLLHSPRHPCTLLTGACAFFHCVVSVWRRHVAKERQGRRGRREGAQARLTQCPLSHAIQYLQCPLTVLHCACCCLIRQARQQEEAVFKEAERMALDQKKRGR
jgi:hypothetical protein